MGLAESVRHLKQYKDILKLLWKYGDSDLVKGIGTDDVLDEEIALEADTLARAEELPDDLEKLGPTWIKFGQFLSTRSDLLPAPYINALQRLQDDVETVPFEEIEKIISEELGVRISRAFVEFDREPLAAASLAQTYRGVMRNGRVVAVKVQRPEIRRQIADDLDAFQSIAEWLEERTEIGKRFMLKTTVEEFRTTMLRELDFRREAQNLKMLEENLKEFEEILVPRPVEDFTTSRVLTMEFIEGRKITSISPLRKLELDTGELADTLLKAYLKQIVVDGFYHADPHPGNVFLTSMNRIALLDLGMVAWIPKEMRPKLLRLLIALSEGDGGKAVHALVALGTPLANFDEEGLTSDVTAFVARHQTSTLEELEIGRLVLGLTAMAAEKGLRLPKEFVMIGKTLMNLDQVGLALSKDFNPNEAIRRHLADLMRREQMEVTSLTSLYDSFVETKDFMARLPERGNRILENLANNKLSINAKVIDERYFMVGLQKIANRLTVGLVLAAIIIGAALMMQVETSFRIYGYPGIAIVFFLLAAVIGLILIGRIFFSDEESRKKEQDRYTTSS